MQTAMKAAWDTFCKAEKPALSLTGGKTLSRKFNMLCDCTFDLIKETKMQMLTSHYAAQKANWLTGHSVTSPGSFEVLQEQQTDG